MTNLANSENHVETIARLSKELRHRIAEAREAPEGVTQVHGGPRSR